MRVLLVSALFPTTVYTGGTRVPISQAVELHRLGHEVQLFGGYLSRMPGQDVLATEISGFPARLVDVAGKLDPDDPAFFVNRDAEREFAKLLESRFDLVHFHSLQGLGSELLRMARAAGARTVVQMHDFYWVCNRQFLVTKDLRPCMGPGGPGCPCPAPDQATSARIAQLEYADALLAPTDEMRTWLGNLGLDHHRIQVAGWPPAGLPEPCETSQWATSAPYLLYLGGQSGEKGWLTLLFAAWGDETRTLRVLCPGVPERAIPGELSGLLIGGPAATREEIALLMSRAHGVVIPSLAAETFSYVAREALGLGIPVAITDGPGGVDCWLSSPESVQLVPRGRPDHLRAAMLALLGRTAPDHHTRSRSPAGGDLGEQLLSIYATIEEGARS
jgi:glycosyltransferase involved in cell wall biosynthesis